MFRTRQTNLIKTVSKQQNIKTVYKFSVIAICVFYLLYFVTIPIFSSVAADVKTKETVLPHLLNFLGKIFEVCGISTIYATTIFSIYKRGASAFGKAYLICSVSAIIKCAVAQTLYLAVNGGVPSFNNGLFEEALITVILPSVLEVIQFTIFFFIVKGAIMRYREAYEAARLSSGKSDYPSMDRWVYPFSKTVDLKNPLLRGCFFGGVIIWASKTLSSLLAELDMYLNDLTIKTLADVIDTVATYASDIACGVLAYTLMVLLIIKFFELVRKNKKTN